MSGRVTWHVHRRDAGEVSQRKTASRNPTSPYRAQQYGSRYPANLPPLDELPRPGNFRRSILASNWNIHYVEPQFAAPQNAPIHPDGVVQPFVPHSQQLVAHRPKLSLWSSYQVRDKSFYAVGRVFRIAPHERVGDSKKPEDAKFVTQDCYGRQIISKPRICIVIEEHKGYCNVITINGYSDRGLGKRLTDASEHAVARTDMDQSPPSKKDFQRANQMLQEPICIIPDRLGDNHLLLRSCSVVDFGKVIAVQHYHEAEPFGVVADQSMDALRNHYNTVRSRRTTSKTVGVSLVKTPSLDSFEETSRSLPAVLSTPLVTNGRQSLASPSLSRDESHLSRLFGGQSAEIHKCISNSVGIEEERDGAFRQQPREFFSWGVVFRLLSWEEQPTDEESEITEMIASEPEEGAPILRRVLWLVVIQEGEESCKCLRIMTYEGRGVSELPPGLSRGDHSIIYTGRDIPEPSPNELPTAPGESQLGLPVCVRQCNRTEKLFPTARILWTRVYDVKLDVKAKPFGRISSRCEHVLETQFRQLNPGSSVDARRPRSSGSIEIASQEAQRPSTETSRSDQVARIPDHAYASESHDSDGSEVSSSGSSQADVESPEKQTTQRTYGPGDAVVLLTGKDGPPSCPPLRSLLVNTARLKRDEDGDLVWEYDLTYLHGGQFQGGMYFDEGLLMPA